MPVVILPTKPFTIYMMLFAFQFKFYGIFSKMTLKGLTASPEENTHQNKFPGMEEEEEKIPTIFSYFTRKVVGVKGGTVVR